METKELLRTLSEAVGVAGLEGGAVECAKRLAEPYVRKLTTDPSGNLIAEVWPAQQGQPHILLDAHIDEIGMIVTSVEENGFLHVSNCGGVDRKVLLAQEVVIHGKEELVGVIASKPPHLASADDAKKTPEMDEILIDTGLSTERVKQLISPGDRVTVQGCFRELLGDRVSGKALDDRAGVAALIKAAELLQGEPCSCGLTLLLSTQEETGTRGATTGGFAVQPDIALSVDVSFALTSDAPEHKCGKMGEGAMIGVSPTLDAGITNQLIEIAERCGIPHQLEVMGGETSTNADVISLAGSGVKTGLCSIPLRYMHTPIETIAVADVDAVARLLAEFVREAGKQNA